MNKNQKGFTAVEGLILLVVVGIIGFAGWHIASANKKSSQLNSASKSQSSTQSNLNKKSTTKATQTPVAGATAPAPASTTTPTKKSSTSKSGSSSPAPTPTPAPPSATTSISISSDGCYVTANAPQGYILDVLVYQGGHGGEPEYTMPASGTLKVTTGASIGYTVDATISNNGSKVAEQVGTVTVASCPAADVVY